MPDPTGDTCPRCGRAYADGNPGCDDSPWRQDGRVILPIRFGQERLLPDDVMTCHDCGTRRGGTHHLNCDVEECPHGDQALSCDLCPPVAHDPYHEPGPMAN